MIALWVIVGLIISTVAVSILGAAFSVDGLAALFSGAVLAVSLMAASLEFAKFVLAAYLHQRWNYLNKVFRTYLTFAIVVLSLITSMGIFGFLSNAYQSASSVLDAENIKLASLKTQIRLNNEEIVRLTKAIDEVPERRVTKKMELRATNEPAIAALTKQTKDLEKQITGSDLEILKVQQKVGPLVYISKAFKMSLDDVVKYLIMIFVLVFDPLAICLVIATSEAIASRKAFQLSQKSQPQPQPQAQAAVVAAQQVAPAVETAATPSVASQEPVIKKAIVAENKPAEAVNEEAEEVIEMQFVDEKDRNAV